MRTSLRLQASTRKCFWSFIQKQSNNAGKRSHYNLSIHIPTHGQRYKSEITRKDIYSTAKKMSQFYDMTDFYTILIKYIEIES